MHSSGEYRLLELWDIKKGHPCFQSLPGKQAEITFSGSLVTPWAKCQHNLNQSLAPSHIPFCIIVPRPVQSSKTFTFQEPPPLIGPFLPTSKLPMSPWEYFNSNWGMGELEQMINGF